MFVCRLCQRNKIKLGYFKEHSLKCFEIAKLKEELRLINDWLLKECERAKTLKNNIGFDLLIANHITNRGSETIDDEQKSIDMKLEAEKKALAVVKEMSKTKFYASKNKKCPTTGDFTKILNSQQDSRVTKPLDASSQGTNQPIGTSVTSSFFDSQATKRPSGNILVSKVEEEDTPTQRQAEVEKSVELIAQKSTTKPSRFKEIYKKPSGSMEIKKESSGNCSEISEEKSKKSIKEVECVGDLFESDEEKSQEEPKKLQPVIAIKTDSQELQDSPELIDDMFSDHTSGKLSRKSKVIKFFDSKKTDKAVNNKISTKTESKIDQLESPKLQNENLIENRRQPSFQGVNRSGLVLGVHETQSDRAIESGHCISEHVHHQKIDFQAHRVYQKSKFSALRGHKNFATQFFNQGNKPEEESTKKEPVQTMDLSRDIEMAKICNNFFEKVVK